MPTLAQLTEEQFKHLLDDYFAPPPKRHKMTETEIRNLAEKLNDKINIPFFGEKKEEKILVKIVLKVDTFLYDNLPNEYYEIIRDAEDGITDEEAKRIIVRLARLANDKIDIPYVPEKMEYLAIRFILGVVINAARKHWDFLKAKESAGSINPPDVEKFTDKQLEGVILS